MPFAGALRAVHIPPQTLHSQPCSIPLVIGVSLLDEIGPWMDIAAVNHQLPHQADVGFGHLRGSYGGENLQLGLHMLLFITSI